MNLSPRQAQRAPRRSRLRAGFTLIEILVVIVVIAILATLVAPNIFQHVGAAKNWRSPYLRKPVPLDPWGRAYVYLSPGQVNPQGYDLQTYGADGKPGGEGEDADITSWK
jgi:general secretion pathway protein G